MECCEISQSSLEDLNGVRELSRWHLDSDGLVVLHVCDVDLEVLVLCHHAKIFPGVSSPTIWTAAIVVKLFCGVLVTAHFYSARWKRRYLLVEDDGLNVSRAGRWRCRRLPVSRGRSS